MQIACRQRAKLARRAQRGLSLVELMMGLALGLFVAGCAGALLVAQLRDYRAIMLEARLNQELRTAANLIARDLRRAGYWGHAGASSTNPYATLASGVPGEIALSYSQDATENDVVDSNEQFGFRLHSGAIELQLGAGNWQALTDASALTVTTFKLTPALQDINLAASCARACTAELGCAPLQQLRSVAVEINAQLVTDARVARTLSDTVQVRSDAVIGGCAA